MERKHYGALDGLRGISAILIILMHVLLNGKYDIFNYGVKKVIASFGNLIFLFMVISAFGMCCGYYKRITENKISVSEFYSKRYKKILPFFAILVVIDVLVNFSVDSLCEGFADLTLLFGFMPNAGNISVIGVGWFLGVIFVFYLIFPFFCYLLENKKRAWFAFIISIIYNYIGGLYFGLTRTNILFCGCYFIAGGLIYLYKDKLECFAKKFKWIFWIIIPILLLLYYLIKWDTYTPIYLLISCSLLIYAIGASKGLLQNKVTRLLSEISMEIYLSHMMIFRVIEKFNLEKFLGNGYLNLIIVFILTVSGAVIFSLIVKKLIAMAEGFISKGKAKRGVSGV